jgi:pimeloyl-ACP methyl ester carboxylesterase
MQMTWLKHLAVGIAVVVTAIIVFGLISIEVIAARRLSSTRIETPTGIESLEVVEIGGVRQTIYLRGHDQDKPVLLFLHGGPGAASIAFARNYGLRLEEEFVVVHWDQRGAGSSCSPDVPNESLNLEQFLSDTLELVHLLRARFDTEKIVLVGHSWGSVLGVMTVQRNPELFHAYVGMGQVVNTLRNEEVSLRFVLESAKAEGNEQAIRELSAIQPPYADNADLMLQRGWLSHYHGDSVEGNILADAAESIFLNPEYSLGTKLSFYSCLMNTLDHAWGDLDHLDFIESARKLDVHVFFFAGRHDYNTPFELVEEYFEVLEAPSKEIVWFENSAHSPNEEESDRYQRVLIERVLPLTKNTQITN